MGVRNKIMMTNITLPQPCRYLENLTVASHDKIMLNNVAVTLIISSTIQVLLMSTKIMNENIISSKNG